MLGTVLCICIWNGFSTGHLKMLKAQLFVWLSFVVGDVVDKFRYYSIVTVSLMNRFKGYIRRKHVKM